MNLVMLASSQARYRFFHMRNLLNVTDAEHGVISIDDASSSLNKVNKDMESKDSVESLDHEGIGSLLPDDEDELLAGITDDFDLSGLPSQVEELEECDLFGSGGGMELDTDPTENLTVGLAQTHIGDGYAGNEPVQYAFTNGAGTVTGEHPYGEHPSRTLFVRNINSNVEDSELRSLFEELHKIFQIFIGQIRLLFGLKSNVDSTEGISNVLESERGFTEW